MDKSTVRNILNHLKDSREIWTDIFKLINLKNGTHSEHAQLISDLVNDGHIKLKDKNAINYLKNTRKGKLIRTPELNANITETGKNYLSNYFNDELNRKKTSNKATSMKNKITSLIQRGELFNIENSFHSNSYEWSVEFSSWLIQVEDVITKLYSKNSPIYNNFSKFSRVYTTESKQEKLDRRLSSAMSSLSSCLEIEPEINKETYAEDTQSSSIVKKKVKYQVFISSTFLDLKEERQDIVQAVLYSANIPAGMELFSAGNTRQWDLIKNWIDDSDMFVLLLGGRYGCIEPNSGLSYIELEFDYAVKKNKNLFAVILEDQYLKNKSNLSDLEIFEKNNQDKYDAFKSKVLSNISAFCNNRDQIKTETLKSISNFEKNNSDNMSGWISADGSEIKLNFLDAHI